MATRSKISYYRGYCEDENIIKSIKIQYTSNPLMGDQFIKTQNKCDDDKCNLRNECSIFKDAPKEIEVDKNNLIDQY